MTNKDSKVNDWQQPFEPLFLVDIDSNGGNIGRFYWQNQSTLIAEQWGENNFHEKTITTLPGYCAWLFSYFDWIGWCMGGFCY